MAGLFLFLFLFPTPATTTRIFPSAFSTVFPEAFRHCLGLGQSSVRFPLPPRLFSLRKVCPGSWISNMISSEKNFDMDLGGGLEKVWHHACETVYEPYSVPLLQWCSVPVEMVQSPLEML